MKNNKLLFILITIAILIKVFLFIFGVIWAPHMKIESDSGTYLELAKGLYSKGAFATVDAKGVLQPEMFRTPGYPVFVSLLHEVAKIPLDGVVLVQVLLTCLTAWLVYKIALQLEARIALLSVVICLLDVPSTMWSLQLVTEALFTLILTLVVLMFVLYLKKADTRFLIFSALLLALATYVRPISYFLGIPVALFVVYANAPKDLKKAFVHAVVFGAIVFSLLGLWSIRNYHCCKTTVFSGVSSFVDQEYSIKGIYAKERYPQKPGVPNAVYYTEIAVRSLSTMMCNPGSWKYLRNPVLAPIGKVLAYLFMFFWMPCLITGIFRIGRNIYFQFLALVAAYFIAVTVYAVGLVGNERFRVVIWPCISIISAYGWLHLKHIIQSYRRKERT
jgi:hypothetical protein